MGVINTWKTSASLTCIIGGNNTLKTRDIKKHVKRVCAFNLARSITGWMTARGYQVLYTQGQACSDVVSWVSENPVNQMTRLIELELDVKEPQWA